MDSVRICSKYSLRPCELVFDPERPPLLANHESDQHSRSRILTKLLPQFRDRRTAGDVLLVVCQTVAMIPACQCGVTDFRSQHCDYAMHPNRRSRAHYTVQRTSRTSCCLSIGLLSLCSEKNQASPECNFVFIQNPKTRAERRHGSQPPESDLGIVRYMPDPVSHPPSKQNE